MVLPEVSASQFWWGEREGERGRGREGGGEREEGAMSRERMGEGGEGCHCSQHTSINRGDAVMPIAHQRQRQHIPNATRIQPSTHIGS